MVLESQRETVPRVDDDELATTMAFLRFARGCALKKLDGLDDEAVRRPMVVSGTSLLGLVRHLAVGERYWLGWTFAGDGDGDAEWDFGMDVPASQSVAEVVQEYVAACSASDAIVAAASGPEARVARPVDGRLLPLRWVLAHLTGETTRHAGHADILRELIDGVTGR